MTCSGRTVGAPRRTAPPRYCPSKTDEPRAWPPEIMGPRYFPAFDQQGYFEWKAKAAGQPISVRVTPAHFKEFVEHDTSFVKRDFPKVRAGRLCACQQ